MAAMMEARSRPGLTAALLCLPTLLLLALGVAQLFAKSYDDWDSLQQPSPESMIVHPETRPSRLMLTFHALLWLGLWIGGLVALTRTRDLASEVKTRMTRSLFVIALIVQVLTFPFAVLAVWAVLGLH
jgi:hypothetical protein